MRLIKPHPEAQLRETAEESQVLCRDPLMTFLVFIPLYVCLAPRKDLEQTVTHPSVQRAGCRSFLELKGRVSDVQSPKRVSSTLILQYNTVPTFEIRPKPCHCKTHWPQKQQYRQGSDSRPFSSTGVC